MTINVFQPTLGERELAAVAEVFACNWLGHGPRTRAFEAAFAEHLGVEPEHLVFINSATAGLFTSVELLDLHAGDEVVLPSISFVAAGNAVVSTGATPVFCDVDPATLNPTAEHIATAITPRTKAVLVLHYGGRPGDIAAIAELCRARGIPLIEDAACAVASSAHGTAVGTFGDLAMWSFDAMKVLVTGDGGMLYVRDREQADRARALVYHGLAQSSGFLKAKVAHRWWELNVIAPGRRQIGNDITAAIGLVQLDRLPDFIARRAEVVVTYDRELRDIEGLELPPALPGGHVSSHYFYWVRMPARIRDAVATDLLEAGVYTTFRYPPLHKVPAYASAAVLPGAEQAAEETLNLPLHQGLTDDDVRLVVTELRKAVEARLSA
ncbi:DegT/DnrJ/EryC1/StrS family aminotransferase [Actinokineospora sp. G85]|uniref:DegT/DnrJ/EryC1/StrS family aminotransferase n=1 Tax=Actinokineospora sp. G85 TaxID=3406626 RepID=UPI003C7179E9